MVAKHILIVVVAVPALLAATAGASFACCKSQFVRTKPHVNVAISPKSAISTLRR